MCYCDLFTHPFLECYTGQSNHGYLKKHTQMENRQWRRFYSEFLPQFLGRVVYVAMMVT